MKTKRRILIAASFLAAALIGPLLSIWAYEYTGLMAARLIVPFFWGTICGCALAIATRRNKD